MMKLFEEITTGEATLMKYQSLILILISAAILAGCGKDVKVETNDTAGKVTVTIPQDATAAELIQARGVIDASYTLRAERERMAYDLAAAKLRKSERQFYAVLIVGGVVAGIVSVFSIACVLVIRRVGGAKI